MGANGLFSSNKGAYDYIMFSQFRENNLYLIYGMMP